MSAVPITLVTGFLGSGKSTIINRLLEQYPDRKFGLVVNEFGDVQLESNIVEADESSIVELSNGCMCCVIRGDLLGTVDALLARRPEIDHILMEASGLSDPVPIANTFLNADLGGTVRFDSIVCLLDLEHYERNIREYDIPVLQLEHADFIVLSKTERMSVGRIQEARRYLETVDTQATVLRDDEPGGLALIIDTLDIDHTDIRELEVVDHDHEHEHAGDGADGSANGGFDHYMPEHSGGTGRRYHHAHEAVTTLFFRSDMPLYADHFGKVFQSLPSGVVRAKGFLDLADEEAGDRKYILQYTGARKDLYSVEWNEGEPRQSAIVFIGRDFDASTLRSRLDACINPLQTADDL
ncbi:MAG: CobW family GTP-binding protein [Spirochaetia bacterium]